MTTTDLDDLDARLTRHLHRLAGYAPVVPSRDLGEPPMVTTQPSRSRSVPTWAIAAGIAAVVSAGATGLAIALDHDSSAPQSAGSSPAPVVHQLTIRASDFHFQAPNFDVPAGITRIKFVSEEGSHTLVFAEPELAYVHLAVPGGRSSAKVELHAGRVYTVFCTIRGHRALGLQATITVARAPHQAK
jgi:plastocyanin